MDKIKGILITILAGAGIAIVAFYLGLFLTR